MSEASHRSNARTLPVSTPIPKPYLVPTDFARPDIPPSNRRTPSRRESLIHDINEDYKLLFRILFMAIELFDRCDDCETLIDAGKLFQYLGDLAADSLEEAWDVS